MSYYAIVVFGENAFDRANVYTSCTAIRAISYCPNSGTIHLSWQASLGRASANK